MGYYTKYTLYAKSEIIEDLCSENDNAAYALLDEQESKWYDHERELREFSKKYPDELFILEGHGEEQGDDWKKYFRNGLMQMCKGEIVYEEFKPQNLA